jgi:hypothetical protein
MQYEPVMGFRDLFLWNERNKLPFGLQRVLCTDGQSQPVRDPENMGVDRHGGLIEYDGRHYIGSFPAHAWQFL